MRSLLIAAVAASVVGCGSGGGGSSLTDAANFGDWPERYKGKTVELDAEWSPMIKANGMVLRAGAGMNCPFAAGGRGGATVKFWVVLPDADKMPNAQPGDRLRVRFVCEQGKLNEGNRGTLISRPPD